MSKPIFTHEDLMREIAARAELRLATHEEERSAREPARIIPFVNQRRTKSGRKTYRFH